MTLFCGMHACGRRRIVKRASVRPSVGVYLTWSGRNFLHRGRGAVHNAMTGDGVRSRADGRLCCECSMAAACTRAGAR